MIPHNERNPEPIEPNLIKELLSFSVLYGLIWTTMQGILFFMGGIFGKS